MEVMSISEAVRLLEVTAWPIVVLITVILFRRYIPKVLEALSARVSRVTAGGLVILDFAAAQPAPETLRVLEEIREPTSVKLPPRSEVKSLLELARTSPPAEYIVVDLRGGQAWLTSRLYLFATVLPAVLGLRCFVFVSTRDGTPKYFFGLVSPQSVVRDLERHQPWLRRASVEAHLKAIATPEGKAEWNPGNDPKAKAAFKQLVSRSTEWNSKKAIALSEVVRSLIDPIDLQESPGAKTVEDRFTAEIFVNRFLASPEMRGPNERGKLKPGWVRVNTVDEHARWIKDERDLLDLFGDDLRREQIVVNSKIDNDAQLKATLRKRGDFVALTDPEGRFIRLIDRLALLEKSAAG